MSLLAIGWEPEIRGLLTVIMAVVVLCGSIYCIMATNMGSRLAFLVVLAALFGWMMLMGITWWIYGIGLRGPDPTWAEVAGPAVLQDIDALYSAGILDPNADVPDGRDLRRGGRDSSREQLPRCRATRSSTRRRRSSARSQAAATVFLIEEEALHRRPVRDRRGVRHRWRALPEGQRHARLPRLLPRAALRACRGGAARAGSRPSRAVRPCRPTIDENRSAQYVYMVRDLGARRQPATVLTIGGGAIFLALCYLLHRRDAFLRAEPRHADRPAVRAEAAVDAPERDKVTSRSDHGSVPADRRVDDPRRGVRRGQLRGVATARTQPAVVGQGSAVRVRHRAVA